VSLDKEDRQDIVNRGASFGEEDVVCPWCGHEHGDSWEYSDGNYDCEECEKRFSVSRDVCVTFSTQRTL